MHLRICTGYLSLLQAGVQKLIMNGRLRVSFKPLLNSVPIIAAIQVRACLLRAVYRTCTTVQPFSLLLHTVLDWCPTPLPASKGCGGRWCSLNRWLTKSLLPCNRLAA